MTDKSMLIRIAADAAELKRNLAETRNFVEVTTASLGKMVKSFDGTKLIQHAHNITAAVEKIGGAARLTEREKQRLNATLTKAIEKYQALGKDAPKAMLDLEQATRKVEQPASALTAKMVALGSAIGSFVGNVGANAVQALGQSLLAAAANGAKLSAMEASFNRLTASIGQSGAAMLSVARTATKGLVADLDLMQASNKAILLGLPVTSREMGELAKTAMTLGRAMGQDATKSLDDLITALGRSSPQILDNLGLTVKLGEANDAYAKKLKITSDQLTEAEKKTAFYNAAMKAADQKMKELGEVQLGVIDQLKRLGVGLANVVTGMSASANQSSGFAGVLGDIADAADRATRRMRDLEEARRRLAVNPGPMTMRAMAGGPNGYIDPTTLAVAREMDAKNLADRIGAGFIGPRRDRRAEEVVAQAQRELSKEAIAAAEKLRLERSRGEREFAAAVIETEKHVMAIRHAAGEALMKRLAEEYGLRMAINSAIAGGAVYAPLPPSFDLASRSIDPRMAMHGIGWNPLNQRVSESIPGFKDFFGANLKSFLGGMSSGNGPAGFAANIGAGVLTGGISSLMNMGMGLVTKGIGKLFGGLFGGGEHSRVSDQRDAFFAQYGGHEGLASAGVSEAAMRQLYSAKTMKDFEAAVQAAGQAMGDLAAAEAEAAELLERFSVQWTDFDGDQQMAKFDEALQRVHDDVASLLEQGVTHDAAVRLTAGAYAQLALQAVQAGQAIPAALAPTLRELARMGELTEQQAAALLGLAEQAGPSFAQVQEITQKYGIALEELGARVHQLGIDEVAKQLEADFKTMMAAGANTREVVAGMSEEVNDVIRRAIEMGLEVPASMREMLQRFADQGELVDENGNKLRDLTRINFAEPIAASVDRLIVKLEELIAKIGETGGAFARLPDHLPSAPAATVPTYETPGEHEGAIAMARGGYGVVTRPTLFLAGERGREEFAFSGAHRQFGGGGDNGLRAEIQGLRREFADFPRALAAQMAIARGRGASYVG